MKKKPHTLPRVLTIGSATLDLFIDSTKPAFEESVADAGKKNIVIEEGIKFEITNLRGVPGGGATNAARVLRRLGLSVTAFFKTSNDQLAETLSSHLRAEGVDTRPSINTAKITTGLSIVIPAPSGNKTVLNFRGANDTVEEQELPLFFMKGVDGIYITPLAGKTAELLPKIALEGKKYGAIVMHNPSYYQLTCGKKNFIDALKNIDILLLNSTEAKALHKEMGLDTNLKKSEFSENLVQKIADTKIALDETIVAVLKSLITLGSPIVLVTNGANGVYAANKNNIYFCPSKPTQVINTVGAGDTFGATFFGAHLSGYEIQHALLFGTINSAQFLSSMDGFKSLSNFDELEKTAQI